MKLTWYPKNILVALVLLVAFGLALDLAIDFNRGSAVGLLALIVYLSLDTVLAFNPARWQRHRKPSPRSRL